MISSLFISVQSGDLDAQPIVLEAIKGVFLKWAGDQGGSFTTEKTKESTHTLLRNSSDTGDKHPTGEPQLDQAFLLATVLSGISLPSNRAMLADWLDFTITLSSAPASNITSMLYPISDAISEQVRARLGKETHSNTDTPREAAKDEGDIPLLLHAAELVIRKILPGADDAPTSASNKPSSESAGLFGYVTTVLSGESGSGRAVKTAVRLSDRPCPIGL